MGSFIIKENGEEVRTDKYHYEFLSVDDKKLCEAMYLTPIEDLKQSKFVVGLPVSLRKMHLGTTEDEAIEIVKLRKLVTDLQLRELEMGLTSFIRERGQNPNL